MTQRRRWRTAGHSGGLTGWAKRRKPSHSQIAERAYFIHLQEGERDEFVNWLRADRELTAA